ncbi:MAG: hypothetical protein TECD_00951 [Hyphomicrobiaceae bacterium hypho_1]
MPEQLLSEKACAVVRAYYVAYNCGDIDAMVAMVSDDIVHDVNQGERRKGKDRFHAFCARMAHHYHDKFKDVVIMATSDGTRAAAEFNVSGTYLQTEKGLPVATGQKYVLPAGAFFSLKGKRITRISSYYNLTEWIIQVSSSKD